MEGTTAEHDENPTNNHPKHDWIHLIYIFTCTICFIIQVYQRIKINFIYISYTPTYIYIPSINRHSIDGIPSFTTISYIWYLVLIWQALWTIYSLINIFRRTPSGTYFYQYPCAMNKSCCANTAFALLLYLQQLTAGVNNTYNATNSIIRHIGVTINVIIANIAVHKTLPKNLKDYYQNGYVVDIWLTRLLYQNGLAIWLSIIWYESCLSITNGLIYHDLISASFASFIQSFLILILIIVEFIFENTMFHEECSFTLSSWIVFLCLTFEMFSTRMVIKYLAEGVWINAYFFIVWFACFTRLVHLYFLFTRVAVRNPNSGKMEDLSKQSYWDKRFLTEDAFEWFGDCSRLYPVLDLYLKSTPSLILLHLGCGSSSLAEEMFQRHYCHFVLNVDYSFGILHKRRSMKTNPYLIDWLTLDIRMMPLYSNCFDTIIEKGTLDVFFVGHEHHLWKPSEEIKEKIDGILTQISQCLRSDSGRFISISFQQPHFRRPFLTKTKYQWSIQVHSISGGNECVEYFVYVMTKGEQLCEEDRLLEEGRSKKWYWINKEENLRTINYIEENDEQYLSNINFEGNE